MYYRELKRNKNHKKYIYPRVVAELMRLKTFWSFARIPQSFFDSILSKSTDYPFALPICNWEIEERKQNTKRKKKYLKSMNERMDLVKERWIVDQINYYDNRSAEYEKRNAWGIIMKKSFFWLPFILATGLLAIYFWCQDFGNSSLYLPVYREFLIGVFPFLFSFIGWLLEKKNWDVQAAEYRRMSDLFRKTANVMNEVPAGSDDQQWALIRKKQEYIKKLVEISHDENSDWQEIKHKTGEPEPMF